MRKLSLYKMSLVALLLCAAPVLAQGSFGTLTGYTTDPDEKALPGVTVVASGPTLQGTRIAVSDTSGYYRLLNLPPGEYKVEAELDGFSPIRHEGIEVRAGATFRLDLALQLGAVEDLVVVTGEAPMLEMENPGQVLTIDGDFQRAVPVQSRNNWSDVLEMTPGVHARPFDDGSGRMVYFGHATEHFAHVIQLEGQPASGYRDAQATYVQMSTDIISDMEVRTMGADAASPLGTGLVMNVVTKSGGNEYEGSVAYTYQPLDWNGDNTATPDETATLQTTKQADVSIGGPIVTNKVWFFGAVRNADNEAGISRTAREIEILNQYASQTGATSFIPFNNIYEGTFPYGKITAQLNTAHNLSAYFSSDEVEVTGAREIHASQTEFRQTGGELFGAKLNSLLSNNVSSELVLSYNNKTSSFDDPSILARFTGPMLNIYQDSTLSGSRRLGRSFVLEDQNQQSFTVAPSSVQLLRFDVTYFKDGWGGSHEFKAGLYYAPKNRRDDTTYYVNGGFVREDRVAINPDDLSEGTIPFRRRFRDPDTLQTIDMEDQDIGVYLQDSWKPNERLSIKAGLRVDFIKRHDNIYDITRMDDTAVGPRFGFSYLLSKDAKNILRGNFGRVHEQVNGRDFATSISSGITVTTTDIYDTDLDGVFDSTFDIPAETPELARLSFAEGLEQPYTDEFVLGYRRQIGRDIGLDIAYIHREVKNRYAQVDINGIYPDSPGQPFGGFGLIDPDRGRFLQITNNTWADLVYDALEVTLVKRMSNNWQAMVGFNYQEHEIDGTWNPTDPARFIQPDAHRNTKCIWMPRGLRDDNSYQLGTNSTYCPTWRPYSLRLSGTYQAPWGILVSGNFNIQAGPWSGPILTELDEYTAELEALYGPEDVVSSTGNVETNPLATLVRFRNATRDEGQVRLDDVLSLSLRVSKKFRLPRGLELEVAGSVFNPFNWDDHHQYNYSGANLEGDSNFLEPRSRQQPRTYQVFAAFRF